MSLASIIVPTYYRDARLREALDSVRSQTYDPIEIIVVDDSGEQYARDDVESADDVEYIAHDVNQGAHAARDTGLQQANGDYVQFLDDDDRLKPEKISKQVEFLQQHDDVGVVYCGLVYEDGARYLPDPAVRGDVLDETLRFYDHPLTTSTMLIDGDSLDEIRPLHRDSAGADDIRMAIELAQRTQFDFIDEVLVTAGRPTDSRGVSWGGVEGRWSILEDYAALYDDSPPEVRRQAMAETYQMQGRRYLEDRLWSLRAIYSFGQALRYATDTSLVHVGEFVSSLAGRPGRQVAQRIIR